MEDSNNLEHHDDSPNKKINEEIINTDNKEHELTANQNSNKFKENTDLKVKLVEVSNDKINKEIIKENAPEENKKVDIASKLNAVVDKTKHNLKEISKSKVVNAKSKPIKEPPVEKKPFVEFVNNYLIPEIKNEFKLRGKEVNKIILQKTNRPIAEDICWVIYCEIKDTCNFSLSFEKDDITSLKSFSLCKNYEKPSIIESFLIDEKKITLKLIISRVLQRLNGQKLFGAN